MGLLLDVMLVVENRGVQNEYSFRSRYRDDVQKKKQAILVT